MRKSISVEKAAKEWMRYPKFRAAYDALEEEFSLAEALIRARREVGKTSFEKHEKASRGR